jgi:hypothetical protein
VSLTENIKVGITNISQYQSDHLFLLVGTNPLPNYVAGKLLAKPSTHFYLVHTNETNKVADRLVDVLKLPDGHWTYIPVNPADTCDIYSKVYETAKGKEGVGLHYTAGKKSMSVHAYRAIYDSDTNSFNDRVFSYLDANNLELLIDRKNCTFVGIPVRLYVKPPIEELLALHGYTPKPYTTEPFHPEIGKCLIKVPKEEFREWCNYNLRKDDSTNFKCKSELKTVQLPSSGSFEVLNKCWEGCQNLGELADHWGKKVDYIAEWLDGKWLEHYTLQAVKTVAEANDIHTAVLGMEAVLKERKFEIDVVALKGYQLIVLSCTTDSKKGLLKQKLFEAFVRGKQLGGDEAKIGLISFADSKGDSTPKIIREEIEEEWDAKGKFCVLGHEHLENLSSHLQEWFRSFE